MSSPAPGTRSATLQRAAELMPVLIGDYQLHTTAHSTSPGTGACHLPTAFEKAGGTYLNACMLCLDSHHYDAVDAALTAQNIVIALRRYAQNGHPEAYLQRTSGMAETMLAHAEACSDPHDLGVHAAVVLARQAVAQVRIAPHHPAVALVDHRPLTDTHLDLQVSLSPEAGRSGGSIWRAVNATLAAQLTGAGVALEVLDEPLPGELLPLLRAAWPSNGSRADVIAAVRAAVT